MVKEGKRSGPSTWRFFSGGVHVAVSIGPADSTGQESDVHLTHYGLAGSTRLILRLQCSLLEF